MSTVHQGDKKRMLLGFCRLRRVHFYDREDFIVNMQKIRVHLVRHNIIDIRVERSRVAVVASMSLRFEASRLLNACR